MGLSSKVHHSVHALHFQEVEQQIFAGNVPLGARRHKASKKQDIMQAEVRFRKAWEKKAGRGRHLHELEVGCFPHPLEVALVGKVVHFIQTHDVAVWKCVHKMLHHVRPSVQWVTRIKRVTVAAAVSATSSQQAHKHRGQGVGTKQRQQQT